MLDDESVEVLDNVDVLRELGEEVDDDDRVLVLDGELSVLVLLELTLLVDELESVDVLLSVDVLELLEDNVLVLDELDSVLVLELLPDLLVELDCELWLVSLELELELLRVELLPDCELVVLELVELEPEDMLVDDDKVLVLVSLELVLELVLVELLSSSSCLASVNTLNFIEPPLAVNFTVFAVSDSAKALALGSYQSLAPVAPIAPPFDTVC